MLLEVTLRKADDDLGKEGDKFFINFSNVVAIGKDENNKSIIYLDISDLDKFKKVYIKEKYDRWNILRLNP